MGWLFHYERRRPETTVLYQVLQRHLEPFLANVERADGDRVLPYFVERELRDFLGCGILAKGFLRVRCSQCRHDRVVAFSCKRRGFCPSCGGRRMVEKAAHLVDHVFPEVPVRQWVLSLPHRIRYRLAYDQDACTVALRAFMRTVFVDLRRRAKLRHGVSNGKPGGITFVQRFASSLALNVHFHSLVLDGVYETRDDGSVRFVPLPPPTDEQVVALTKKVGRSVLRALARAGKLLDELDPEPDTLATDQPALAALHGSSVLGRVATGDRAGRQVERLGDRVTVDDAEQVTSRRCAEVLGFSLHADVAVPARDRKRLERLCRYVARPPLATDRLHRRSDGKLVYLFRKPWRDGTRGVMLTPAELIEKLIALVPPPQANLLRYHGVLAPGSKLRRQVVGGARSPNERTDAATTIAAASWPASTLGAGSASTPRRGISMLSIIPDVTAMSCEARSEAAGGTTSPSPAGAISITAMLSAPSVGFGERPGDLGHRLEAIGRPRMTWAELMKRVFALDVLECPICRGSMKIIAEITQPSVIRRFLAALDLPSEPPEIEPARPPPQMELDWGDGVESDSVAIGDTLLLNA